MWSIEPEAIYRKPRAPGISAFMRLKNEAEFVDHAIRSHIDGLDELVIVHNDCSDETPEICARWQQTFPDKIRVYEYEPTVVPWFTPESLKLEPTSPHSYANYQNFALEKTNRKIVIKIDGDHIAVRPRFNRICDYVRKHLPPKMRYPIYGLNITTIGGQLGIYNYYDFHAEYPNDVRQGKRPKIGPPPFTDGDHLFFHVDENSYYTVAPTEGFDAIDLRHTRRSPKATFTYAFFHMKGMKAEKGVSGWGGGREQWAQNVSAIDPRFVVSLEEMRRRIPVYFRGANIESEIREAIVPMPSLLRPRHAQLPGLSLKERAADVWYRIAYP